MTNHISRREFLEKAGSGAALAAFGAGPASRDSQGAVQTSPLQGVPALDGSLVNDDAALRAAGRDSGGMVLRRPRAVLRPSSVDDVVKIVRYANEQQIPAVMRGDESPTLDEQLSANRRLVDRAVALGGKRYAPYSDITASEWERHYGADLYRRFANAKRRFDPRRILTPSPAIFA